MDQKQEIAKVNQHIEAATTDKICSVPAANAMAIDNDEAVIQITDTLGHMNEFRKEQEKDRKKFTKPLNDVVKLINDRFKSMMKPVSEADGILRKKLGDYQTEKERIRREEEERLQKEQAQKEKEEQEKKKEETKKDVETAFPDAPESEKVEVARELTPDVSKMTPKVETKKKYEGTTTKMGFQTKWHFEVEFELEVPSDYLVVDESAIKRAVDNGVRKIPGVKIWSSEVPYIR